MSHSDDVSIENSIVQPIHKPLHNYRFTQQRLPGWRPILTTFWAIVMLFCCCAVLLAMGLVFFFLQNGYNEVRVRYDELCSGKKSCTLEVEVEKDLKGNLELRYELTKFYQNHRRFGFSRIDSQLAGDFVDFAGMSNAKPYRSIDDKPEMKNWILPAGLFALSVFNDTFPKKIGNAEFLESGIAYPSEIDYLYRPLNEKYTEGYKWLEENETSEIFVNGTADEHFMVWMRQSALPTVVKTYSHCDGCEIKAGKYSVTIQNRYPTTGFKGGKYFVISKVTTLGTQNTALGIIYIVCGAVCGIYAVVLLIAEAVAPRKMGELASGSL
ncbi:cell cycle control protein [Tritrichomonas foetus]|uniref:Cell cycle control protein n=1 Tax=Tritrichomonas foetus TaxID=1144522 RepID=A0A1J4JB00_9EUKA|nr:cell cycle control protein [Tritrichomonas foetus]|eukprot:OHS94428.1 cell cycle control protein [Tritrichomonas foetus]